MPHAKISRKLSIRESPAGLTSEVRTSTDLAGNKLNALAEIDAARRSRIYNGSLGKWKLGEPIEREAVASEGPANCRQ